MTKRKTILLAAILLFSACVSKMPEGGAPSATRIGEKSVEPSGSVLFEGTLEKRVIFNGEVVTTIEGSWILAYSLENGLLRVAIEKIRKDFNTNTMYTIDMESKTIIKEERLDTHSTYKDPGLELTIIGDINGLNPVIMEYTRKGETHKVVLPKKSYKINGKENVSPSGHIYISKNGYIVFRDFYSDELFVYSMDKKKFTRLGRVSLYSSDGLLTSGSGWYLPLNEYLIYSPRHSYTPMSGSIMETLANVYIYHYAKEEFYATCYQNILEELKDIDTGIKNGNIYEQFLPLTRVANIDSVIKESRGGCSNESECEKMWELKFRKSDFYHKNRQGE
ncbi:MAG: hypothetical protein LBH25_12970 [Fibromonadaceae bacterium]|nr:hypothetical protein [Fibromonadaceae bacterium]